ncbi:MAG TPA: carboxypeptidase regulatory-like domain-containing protein, partial [Opitutaceae bacterium]|nr:carboxypeptidase regulatory-like domain-containing protein [Opitutaceae bacterium]
MHLPLRLSVLARFVFLFTAAFGISAALAQPATGVIEGRVFDSGRGEYLEKARLTIEGTSQQTFTDVGGQYRFTNVPPGAVKVVVFFTGLEAQTAAVNVSPGQTVQHDITLAAASGPRPSKNAAAGETVKLDQFVVSTSKDMDGAAIAINEQRFARNIMTVVAADEFGTVVDGTPGEVLKFLPGITMDYSAGEARTISINGVPSANVPITVGGFDLASAASGGTSRVTNLDQFSVNNIARIEKNDSPTPESTGSALAGSVNMVPRSAFERSRPSYTASGFLMMKDGERQLHKTPGPLNEPMRKVTLGGNFSAVVPVNKRFGFTLSGNSIPHQYSYEDVAISTWRGAGSATTVAATATNGLPDTTPDKPYLSDFAVRDSTRDNPTASLGTTLDFKLTRNDTLSLGFQWTWIGVLHNPRTLTFFVNRVLPGQWGPTHTTAAPGGFGEVRIQSGAQDWFGTTSTPTLRWRHEGPTWRSEAGLGYSRASLHIRNVDKGFFGAAQARRTGVNVSFSDIFYLRPNTITVTDTNGVPVDPYNLGNYSLVNADDHPNDTRDLKRSVYANTRRDFTLSDVPFTLKGGVDMKVAERDRVGGTKTYTYVGPDRRGSTTPVGNDDAAGTVVDEAFSQRYGPYGFPRIQWIDNHEYYGLYKAHPEYFTIDENAFYRSQVDRNTNAREIISAAYLRGDVAFLQRRLQFTGGLRAEQTNVKGEGRLSDPTLDYRRDAAGHVIDGNPTQAGVQPVLIVPTNAGLSYSQLTYLPRGQHTSKEYLRMFPSIN